MTEQTPPAEQPAPTPAPTPPTPPAPPEPTPEQQAASLADHQAVGETTSPQAVQQQERDGAATSGHQDTGYETATISDDEAATRAAHQGEGGGAWPPELLARQGVQPSQPLDPAALHEQQASEADQQADREGAEPPPEES